MFWNRIAGFYDFFETRYNKRVYTNTGKVVAGNVIHLLTEPQKAMAELERVTKPGGQIIIPTYINKTKKSNGAAIKLLGLLGADFKRQFDPASYKAFFAGLGYQDVTYQVVDGRMPCAIAIINKS